MAIELVYKGGGNVVQADWAQNDETAKDYVKNRTHYEEVEEYDNKVIVTNQTNIGAATIEKIYEQRKTAVFRHGSSTTDEAKRYYYLRDKNNSKNFFISNGEKIVEVQRITQDKMSCKYVGENSYPSMYIYFRDSRETIHKIDEKYLPLEGYATEEFVNNALSDYSNSPLLLDANSAETYLNSTSYGDTALEAIKKGRQILVRVPNADGGSYTAIYSPVYMYQVPNYKNNYLYLFFLRDEKQTLDLTALGMGAVQLPIYGELKMKLSQTYDTNPLTT